MPPGRDHAFLGLDYLTGAAEWAFAPDNGSGISGEFTAL
jgi:hypothetical protein